VNVFEVLRQFFNLLRRGSNLKKLEMVQCFFSVLTFFFKILWISETIVGRIFLKNKIKYCEAMP